MKKLLTLFFLITATYAYAQFPRVDIPGSETRKITSSIVAGQEYELQVLLPSGYSKSTKKYPVVYLMDSQWDFPLVKSTYGQQYYDGFIPEIILVGITWGGVDPNPDSLRARDYTPTKENRLPQSGGADKFLSFMKEELFPFIESNYKADNKNRTIMGCSLGGLVTLYALFTHTDMFTGYVAASPAYGWDRYVIYQYEKSFFEKNPALPARLYMTIGGVERSVPGFERLAKFLADRNYATVQIRSKVLENTGHSGTKSETFGRGLQYVFERPQLTLDESVLKNYTGTYESPNGNKIEIIKKERSLTINIGGSNYDLLAASETDFYSTSEFLNMHFKITNSKIEGFQLDRYGSTQFIKRTNPAPAPFPQKTDSLPSRVYNWDKLDTTKEETRIRRQIMDGSTTSLANLEVHTSTIEPGQSPHPPHTHADQEELIIVKEGQVDITINGVTKTMEPGSVTFAIPGEEHGIENSGKTTATYYVFKYRSKLPTNLDRAKQNGGSFMINWNDVPVATTAKGTRREFFNRPTSQMAKFEMHTTSLGAGLDSHAPHTHIEEEVVLILKGNVTMHIGDNFYKAGPGDVIFLSSGVSHALINSGNEVCEYFAFQWRN